MKRIIYAILATVSGLVLLFSYRTSLEAVMPTDASSAASGTTSSGTTTGGSTSSGSTSSSTGSSGSSGSTTTDSSSGSTSADASSSTTTASGYADGTYTGSAVNTRYGPVQVQITVAGGAITSVDILEYPSGNGQDIQINQRALPILIDETISAQSADVNMVSGATFTSVGYTRSLQSALDQAQS